MINSTICLILLILSVNSASFDEAQSAEMAGLSFAAYCQYSNIVSWTNLGSLSRTYPSYQNVQIFESSHPSIMGFISYNSQNNQIVIVFRGETNQDWIINTQNYYTSFTGSTTELKQKVKNHMGNFISSCSCLVDLDLLRGYSIIKTKMNPLLNDYIKRYPQSSIVFTGHGGGGALATLAAAELAYSGRKVGIITFGQPRFGDNSFYDFYSGLSNILFSFRVVYGEDIVPHLPYQFLGFTHVGQEIWYQTGTTKKICRPIRDESELCSFSVEKFEIEDHMKYTSLLKSGC